MYVIKDSRDMTSINCLFIIFYFKIDFLFIKISNILQQIACKNEFTNYRNLKRLLTVKHFLYKRNACPAFSARRCRLRNILRAIDICRSIAKAHF